VTSSIVRDTSAAVSIARSAMLGAGCGVLDIHGRSLLIAGEKEAATFGYPRVRSF